MPIRYLTLLTAAVAAVAHVYAVLHDGVTLAAVTGAATAAALGGYALLSGARRTRWPLAGALAVLAVAFAARGVWYQPRPTSTYGWFSYGGGPPREYLRSVAQLFDESVSRQRWYAVCALLWAGLLAAVPLTLAPLRHCRSWSSCWSWPVRSSPAGAAAGWWPADCCWSRCR